MAFHLQVGGNTSVVIGGAWNSGSSDAGASWANPFAGATSFTIALSIRPDVPFSVSSTAMSALIHQWGGSASQGTWQLGSPGGGALELLVYPGGDNTTRLFDTAAGAITAGQWNRIMVRWSGPLDQCQITVNGVEIATTKSGVPVTALQNSTGLTGPWEIGAISWRDDWNLAGDYAEVAGWLAYKSDTEAVQYGQGYSPDQLSSAGRIEYVDLRDFSSRTFFPSAGEFHANTVGRWTGINYGVATMVYGTGGVLPYQGFWSAATATPVAHPQVFGNGPGETPIGTPAAAPWWDDPVHPILPQRDFESWEYMGEVGARSGCVLTVATGVITGGTRTAFTAGDIQGAMNSAQYGDDVVVPLTGSSPVTGEDHTLGLSAKTVDAGGLGTTPRCPPRGRTPVTGHVPVTFNVATSLGFPLPGSLTLTAHAADPSYIHVYAAGAPASLPAIIPRNVFMPDGTVRVVYDGASGGSCRVTSTHIPVMATVIGSGIGSGEHIFPGVAAHHWAFRGLYFAMPGCGGNIIVGDTRVTSAKYGQLPEHPDHIIINQCGYNGDPDNDGHGGNRVMQWEGEYIAQINGFVENFDEQGGGENNLTLSFGACWGPLVFRNNAIQLMMTQSWFSGGGNSQSIGVEMQDCQWNYNWQYCPPNWRLSEVNPLDNSRGSAGWVVTIAAATPKKVTCVSGGLSGSFGANGGINKAVYSLCTMYEPATGRARLVSDAFEGENLNPDLTLATAWPGGAGTYSVYFQMPSPNLLYNSGADDLANGGVMPTATVSNGSTAVTVSVAMPQYIKDAVDGGFRPYFYLNNLHWEGGGDGSRDSRPVPTAAGHSPLDNGYTYRTGVTYAQCRRKKIVAIAANRLSFTLENPYIVLGGEVTTFPYSVVCNDGLFRMAHFAGKGAWETKCGASRMEWVGNVQEYIIGGGTLHLNVNTTQGDNYDPELTGNWVGGQIAPYTFTCVNDLVTVSPDPASSTAPPRLPGRYPGNGFVLEGWDTMSRTYNPRGLPRNPAEPTYPYLVLVPQNYAGHDTQWTGGRIVKRVIDMAHFELEPIGGLNTQDAFQCPVAAGTLYAMALSTTAWRTNKGFTHAYNVTIMGSGTTVSEINEGTGEINHGGLINFHDNVYLLSHDPSVAGTGSGGPRGLDARSNNGPAAFGTWNASFGATTQDQSYIRLSRNSYFQTRSSAAGIRGNFYAASQVNPINVLAHHIDVVDNLVAEYGPGPTSLLGQPSGASSIPIDPVSAGVWKDPVDVRRNVFGGPTAPADVWSQAYSARFSDNAGVSAAAAVGFVSYDTGADLSRRVLVGATDPMVLTGYALTTIFSTGTVAIDTTGQNVTLESGQLPTRVGRGQFFKTSTHSALIRIASVVSPPLSASWSAYTGFSTYVQGNGVAFSAGNISGRPFQSHTTALPNNQWVQVTMAEISAGVGASVGIRMAAPNTFAGYLANFVKGSVISLYAEGFGFLAATTLTVTDGDVVLVEAEGTVVRISINATLALTYSSATQFTGGRAGLDGGASGSATKWAAFSAGGYSAPGVRDTALATDNFTGTATQFTLEQPHPEVVGGAAITGKSFALTFQGTATDGRDPGANLSIVEQLTRNVRGASTFVPPPADVTNPTITITGPTSSSTLGTGTGTLTLSGTAADNVAVTFVSWTNDRGGSGTASGTTTWSQAGVVLQSGVNVLTATAHDAAGNTASDVLTVTYTPGADAVNPVCTITTNGGANFGTGSTPQALDGTATDNVGVTAVTWANSLGGSGSANVTGLGTTSATWSIPSIALTSGANVITVTAADAQGNTHADAITVTYTPAGGVPTITITGPTSSPTLATGTTPIVLSGTTTGTVGVIAWRNFVGGFAPSNLMSQGTLPAGTPWTTPAIDLLPGLNVIILNAFEGSTPFTGNYGQDELSVTYQPGSVPPTIAITSPTTNPTYATGLATVALSGTAADSTGIAAVTWANDRGGTGAATVVGTTSATWSIPSIALLAGANVLTVTARNQGNVTTPATLTVTYTVDATNPVCVITSPTSSATTSVSTTPIVLGGTCTDNVGVTSVTWTNDRGGSGSGTVAVPGSTSTTWTISPGITLLSGANVLTVTAHDAAGNTHADVLTATYTPPGGALPVVLTWPGADTTASLTGSQPFVLYFGSGAWDVRNHAAELENAGNIAEGGRCDVDLGVNDYLVTATLEELAGAGLLVIGPTARMQGDTSLTFYSAIALISTGSAPSVSIQKFTAGAQVQLGAAVPITPHAGMTVGIWPLGDRIRALIDGVTVIDLIDPSPISTGHFFGLQGVANTNNRGRVSRLAATADAGPGPAPTGFEVTIRVPGTMRPVVTVRPTITAS